MIQLKFKNFIILNVLDILTTWYGLTFLHLTEANPFANTMFSNMGLVNALIAMKLIGLMVIYGILYIYPLKVKTMALKLMCCLFFLVIINNVYQMIHVLYV